MSEDKIRSSSDNFPWLIFKLEDNAFAVNCECITSITILPENITKIPHMAGHMRGVLNLRGTIIPLLDMRSLFGLEALSSRTDFLQVHIQSHKNWVDKLLETIDTKKPFELSLDPHKCAFGIWYDSYTSDNNMVAHQLKKIDEPHKRLHAIGAEVMGLIKEETPESTQKIEELKEELTETIIPALMSTLERTDEMFKDSIREMIIVLEFSNTKIGLIVDEVHSVDQLTYLSKDATDVKSSYDSRYVKGVGKSSKSDDMILLIDEDMILNTFKQTSAEMEAAALVKK